MKKEAKEVGLGAITIALGTIVATLAVEGGQKLWGKIFPPKPTKKKSFWGK
jgi:hypothetical protein